jgi:hypothetical protein
MVRMLAAACVALTCATSCAPLTFSKEEAIDYSDYPTVRVEVWIGSYENQDAAQYLVEELQESSGFDEIVFGPRMASDAVLIVDVWVTQVDEDKFESSASYELIDSQRRLVDRGEVDDESVSAREAVEDVLDEVALHYHRPYRI